ncbi:MULTISPECIES: hypothetical protein [unclassified Bradyrhizobium]|uniref:hypothetical protein n=1 Tax=Bradyrhizobium TaxID=374 RepID=UPI0028EB74D4|nr:MULTISPECIES: hypothetical protein [unclassified Bradyrhizobium]
MRVSNPPQNTISFLLADVARSFHEVPSKRSKQLCHPRVRRDDTIVRSLLEIEATAIIDDG